MPPKKAPRILKPKHTLQVKGGRVQCWACSALLGESIFPCRAEWCTLTPKEQKDFYRAHHICGRCGQPAGTVRPLCRCNGRCGCSELHDGPVEIEGQEGLFDLSEGDTAPSKTRRGEGDVT